MIVVGLVIITAMLMMLAVPRLRRMLPMPSGRRNGGAAGGPDAGAVTS
jgi:hypothetical protein